MRSVGLSTLPMPIIRGSEYGYARTTKTMILPPHDPFP